MPATTSGLEDRRTSGAFAAGRAGPPPDVSVVVPCKDEVGNLPRLIDEIEAALSRYAFELLIIDDGSVDATAETVADMASDRPWLRLVSHQRSAGQSFALRTGLLAARGGVIATLDGDGQNNPTYVPVLVEALRADQERLALVAGQRVGRKSGYWKRLASRGANRLRQAVLKDGARDTGCGLKVMRRDVFLLLPYFDGWHRYLPALVKREGFGVAFVDVVDREREHGTSKYGILDRGLIGILDLLGVWWLLRRGRRWSTATEGQTDDETV